LRPIHSPPSCDSCALRRLSVAQAQPAHYAYSNIINCESASNETLPAVIGLRSKVHKSRGGDNNKTADTSQMTETILTTTLNR
jgi:hypothetical protein